MINILFLILLNVFSSNDPIKTNDTNEKIFKIKDTIFVTESMFLPGAGHLYNDHYRSAFLSFITTISFFSNAMGHGGYNSNRSYDNASSVSDWYSIYNEKIEYKQEKAKTNTFMLLFLFSYFDAIIDSYFSSNRNLEDSAKFYIGTNAFISGIKTDSLYYDFNNEGAPQHKISLDQTTKKSIGLMFGATYGYLIDKEVFLSLGPQFLFTYDMTYNFIRFKHFSFFFANHFDMQFQMYEFLDDGQNLSYDNYETFNDFFVFGAKFMPFKSLVLESGFSFFTVASTWNSFSESQNADYSQAHTASNGFFNGEYYFFKASVFFTNNINLGMKAKFYYNKESFNNYDEVPCYFKFFRANVFLNYVF